MRLFLGAVVLSFPFYVWALLNPPEIVSLVPPGGYEVLERENQISVLCPETDAAKLEKCRAEKLKPRAWDLPLYEEARKDSKSLGKLVVTVTPGKGVMAEYFQDSKTSVPVKSDSSQTDWGYSSFFEFSILERKGDWMQLPKRPFAKPVWINLKLDWPSKDGLQEVNALQTGTVYSVKGLGDIVITEFSGTQFTYRMENSNDMLCGEEEKKLAPAALKETKKPLDVLFDSDKHLIAWIKYSRGC